VSEREARESRRAAAFASGVGDAAVMAAEAAADAGSAAADGGEATYDETEAAADAADESEYVESKSVMPFLYLSLPLPANPLFKDGQAGDKNVGSECSCDAISCCSLTRARKSHD
jgi:hypothetical protein